MSFELTERIFAVSPSDLGALHDELLQKYGEFLPSHKGTVLTVAAHWDDTSNTKIRGGSLIGGTISPIPLTDGRVAFRCLWQSDLIDAFENGEYPQAEELPVEEFHELKVLNDGP